MGGFLIGSLFALAVLVSVAARDWKYAIAFAVTGVICTLLPLGLVKLIMWWADAPVRSDEVNQRKPQ